MPKLHPVLCADIGGSFIDCAVVTPDGAVRDRRKVPTPCHDLDAFLAILAAFAAPHAGVPLHIALAGLQDPESGACTAANIPCINGVKLEPRLAALLDRPVRIGNDADCFTLAETRLGAGLGHRNVFGLILGTGVGGGVVMEGRLVVGVGGVTGEWGHGPVIPHVPGAERLVPCFPCGCGQRGCIDTIGGARGLERLYRWAGGEAARDSRKILAAWQDGEPVAARTMTLYLDYLSSALALAVNLIGASVVPAGGGLSDAPALLEALDRATRAKLLRRADGRLIVQSRLGGNAGLLGAAFL
ncbi:ROK family protein [Acidomonas methanolica]|uniref:ROK family protein n=1 Tax=Acidomonas methanolica TaxID=437 RepID=UPI00211A6BC3|nr:ROK family protein [Acidomonas methanolica]MCQ9156898.1 ROK family protein [Acidomonas methanolica]